MSISTATTEYESWLGHLCVPNPDDLQHKQIEMKMAEDLQHKHTEMKKTDDPFPFFRGTYYRWVKQWQKSELAVLKAPQVLAIGDLHIENFGTWRDIEGRLCWGINDFDEADTLPYTNDLVRLAASVLFDRESAIRTLDFKAVCDAIRDGYHDCLKEVGTPFVLEEKHKELRKLATHAERDPKEFWQKLDELADKHPVVAPPPELQKILIARLPPGWTNVRFQFRDQAGMGSLGKPRFIALAELAGSWVCREAKYITPAATVWACGSGPSESLLEPAVSKAIRSHDPEYKPEGNWIVRRLAPRCSRIKTKTIEASTAILILRAMGKETANVHLGTPGMAKAILDDLMHRPETWLEVAAKQMADTILGDWKAYQLDG